MIKEIFLEIFAFLCNCLDGYCIEVNSLECLNNSFTTVVINLRGQEAMSLQTEMYSVLAEREYQVELEGVTYLLFCNSREYCSKERTTVGNVNVSTEKDDTETQAITIVATVLGFLTIVLVLLLIAFFCKHQRNKVTLSSTTNTQHSSVVFKEPTNYNTVSDNSQTFENFDETQESSSSLPAEYADSNQFLTSDAASSASLPDHFDSGSRDSCTSLPTSSTKKCQHLVTSTSPLTVGNTEQIRPTSECSSSCVSSLVAPTGYFLPHLKSLVVYSDHSEQTIIASEPRCSSQLPSSTNLQIYSKPEQSAITHGLECNPRSKTDALPSEVQASQDDGTLFRDKSSSYTFSRTANNNVQANQPLSTGAINTAKTHNNHNNDSRSTFPSPSKNGYYSPSIAMRSRTSPNGDITWVDNVSYVSSQFNSLNPNQSNKVHLYETIDEIDDEHNKNPSQQFNGRPDGWKADKWKADKSCPVHGRCDFYSAAVVHSSRRSIEIEKSISHKMTDSMMPFVADNTNNSVVCSSSETNV